MKKFKRLSLLLSFVLLFSLALTGCKMDDEKPVETPDETVDTPDEDADADVDTGGDKQLVIGLSMNTQTNPFFVDVKDGVQKAADEHGIELFVTDAQDDPAVQMKDIENLITKNPDAIIIDPCDSDAIVASVEACNDAGIPVFTMDRESNGGEVVAHIGYDAIKSGNMAAQYLVDSLEGSGKIVELQGIMGTNVAQDRSEGFNEIIDDNPDMEIVASQVADFDRAKAMSVMENILQANPEIDGLYAANDEMLLGALEAIEAAGRSEEIVKIGCDAIDDTIEALKAGRVEATIAEPPFFLGKAILNAAYEHINGEIIDKYVILDNNLVTQDNVDDLVTKE
ncbi:MAG: D-ribose ABC transporter substrate-binding protein [Epulopiscium sp.]|nr:D-ribose ABC transporter substrate-binding protein [Candidatus Epulonipiscium sp.]